MFFDGLLIVFVVVASLLCCCTSCRPVFAPLPQPMGVVRLCIVCHRQSKSIFTGFSFEMPHSFLDYN